MRICVYVCGKGRQWEALPPILLLLKSSHERPCQELQCGLSRPSQHQSRLHDAATRSYTADVRHCCSRCCSGHRARSWTLSSQTEEMQEERKEKIEDRSRVNWTVGSRRKSRRKTCGWNDMEMVQTLNNLECAMCVDDWSCYWEILKGQEWSRRSVEVRRLSCRNFRLIWGKLMESRGQFDKTKHFQGPFFLYWTDKETQLLSVTNTAGLSPGYWTYWTVH